MKMKMKMKLLVCCCLVSLCLAHWVPGMENPGLFEGDMVLSPDQQAGLKSNQPAYASIKRNLWPKEEIPYRIDASLQRRPKAVKAIRDAISDYHKYTCLRFKEVTSSSWGLRFYDGGGCHSPVGYFGKTRVNTISLGDGCWFKGTAIHEMAHSLGFYHEQARPDRDNYVKIHLENIPDQLEYNFRKKSYNDVDSLGTPYDYRSVMHYSKNAFGGGKLTIETLDKRYQNIIGQRSTFSATDVEQMNLLYKCPPTTHTLPPTQSPDCYDEMAPCVDMAKQGKCFERKWKKFMTKSCRFSCGLCGSKTQPPRPPTGQPSMGPRTTLRPQPTGTIQVVTWDPACKDVYITQCADFAALCGVSSWKTYLHKFCRKTCHFC